jgi:hypothetical protein
VFSIQLNRLHFVGSCGGIAQISLVLGYDVTSLGKWLPAFPHDVVV